MASNGFRPALLFLSSSGVSTTASMWRESSPTARDDRWLRADRPSPTKLPSAYRHQKIPAAPSSPLRIKISQIRFAQVGRSSYFSRCPVVIQDNDGTLAPLQIVLTRDPRSGSTEAVAGNSSRRKLR